MDYWFRMEIEGWEQLPEPPALLIGIHSGAPFVWDAWTVGVQWWRRFGERAAAARHRARRADGRAADRRLLPQDGRAARRARQHRRRARRRARRGAVAGRRGRLAAPLDQARRGDPRRAARASSAWRSTAGVPIVPIATVGGPDSMPVLATGRRIAKALQLDKIARLKMFPIALQAPWGISPGDAARDPAADEDPHRVPGADHADARSRARRATTTTSRRKYERGARRASSAGWTRSRAGGGCRCSAESPLA